MNKRDKIFKKFCKENGFKVTDKQVKKELINSFWFAHYELGYNWNILITGFKNLLKLEKTFWILYYLFCAFIIFLVWRIIYDIIIL